MAPRRANERRPRTLIALTALCGALFVTTLTSSVAMAAAEPQLRPTADTFVETTAPHRVNGKARALRVSAVPLRRAYLRFDLSKLKRPLARAQLRVYVNARTGSRLGVQPVAGGSAWSEARTTFTTAPRVVRPVVRSKPIHRRGWIGVDVTRLLSRSSSLNLRVAGAPAARLLSRESARSPRLRVRLRRHRRPPRSAWSTASLTVVQDAVPDGPQAFAFAASGAEVQDFTLDDDPASASPPSRRLFTFMRGEFGQKRITQQPVAGWTLTGIACTGDPDARVDLANRTVSLNVNVRERVECRFTNTRDATVTVVQDSRPDSGQDFAFTAGGAGLEGFALDDDADPALGNRRTFTVSSFGPKTITQQAVAGWTLADLACSGDSEALTDKAAGSVTLDVDPGESIECTFVDARDATITIVQDSRPNDAQDFAFTTTGADTEDFTLDDDADPEHSDRRTFTVSSFGQKTITQEPVAGWTLADLACSGDSGATTATVARSVTLDVDPGESIQCTFVDARDATLTIVQDSRPDSSQDFRFTTAGGELPDFVLDDDTDPESPDRRTFTIAPDQQGAKTITQLPAGDWTLTDITCTGDADSTVDTTERSATLTIDAGENIECTFVSTRDATITIVQDSRPDDAQDFAFTTTGSGLDDFTLDDDTDPGLTDRQTFTLPAGALGAKTITQQEAAGWTLTDITCTGDADSTVDTTERSATLTVDAGENIECTFVSTRDATITIVQDSRPDSGQDFAYTTQGLDDFTLDDDTDPGLTDRQTFTLPAGALGAKTITQQEAAGWTLSDLTCSGDSEAVTDKAARSVTLDVDPGESIQCTFVDAQDTTLTIVQDSRPDSGQDFAFTAAGGRLPGITLDDDTDPDHADRHTYALTADQLGEHTITQLPADGWTLTDITCTGDPDHSVDTTERSATLTVDAGETIQCTFVSSRDATITIVQDSRPDSGQDFAYTTTGADTEDFTLDDDADPEHSDRRTFTVSSFGQKTITQEPVAGWTLADLACSGDSGATTATVARSVTLDVDPGESIQCTFVDAQDTTLTIVQDSRPDSGQDFAFTAAGGELPDFVLDDDTDPESPDRRTFTIAPDQQGAKTITQQAVAGWTLADLACSGDSEAVTDKVGRSVTLDVDPGESIQCTFADARDATITIVQDSRPDSGQDFAYTTTGADTEDFTLDDDTDPQHSDRRTFTVSSFGQKTITQEPVAGWTLADLACTGDPDHTTDKAARSVTLDVDAGESIQCTFVDAQDTTLTIVQDSRPDSGQDFAFTAAGGRLPGITLDDDTDPDHADRHTYALTADQLGEHTITQLPAGDWTLTDITCTGDADSTVDTTERSATLTIDAGENIECTFVDARDATLTIVQDSRPDSGQDFAFTTSGSGLDDFTLDDDTDPELTDRQTFTLPAGALGAKTITQQEAAGWTLSDLTCSGDSEAVTDKAARSVTLDVDPGETIECTFADAPATTLTIVQDSRPDSGQDFAFTAAGGRLPGITLDDDTDPDHADRHTYALTAGQLGEHTITQLPADGWTLTDITCTGDTDSTVDTTERSATLTVDAGENIECTFVDARDATITIVQDSRPNDAQDFAFTTSGSGLDDFTLDDDTDPGLTDRQTFTLPAGALGAKTITQQEAAGWTLTDLACTGDPDHTTDKAARSVTLDVDPGETIECTFADAPATTLTIVQDSRPDSGQDFAFTAAGGRLPGITLDDDTDPDHADRHTYALSADQLGEHTITQLPADGWTLTDITCTGDPDHSVDATERSATLTIDAGENVQCTFVDQRDATITIVQDSRPDSGQDFAYTAQGRDLEDFTLDDDTDPDLSNRQTFTLTPGAFGSKTITQQPADGWTLAGIACTGDGDSTVDTTARSVTLTVDAGETIECTFADAPAPPAPPALPSLIGGVFPESSNTMPIIKGADGGIYTVQELGSATPYPTLRKSADGGLTWTEVDAAGRPGQQDLESVALVEDRSAAPGSRGLVHMLHQRSGGGSPRYVYYHSFTTANGDLGSDRWLTKGELVAAPKGSAQAPTTGDGAGPHDEAVALVERRASGDLIAFYATDRSGGGERVGYKVKPRGGTWGPEEILDSTAGVDITQAVAVMGDDDVAHVFYKSGTESSIYYRTLDASGTLSDRTQVNTYGTHSSDHTLISPVQLHVGATERIVVAWVRSTGRTLNGVIVDDGKAGGEVQISNVPVYNNPASTQSVQPVAGLAADDAGDKVYAVYSDATDHDMFYDVLGPGGTWTHNGPGGDVEMLDGYDVASIQATVFANTGGPGVAGDVLGVVFDDDIGYDPVTKTPDNVPRYTQIPLP